MMRRTTSRWSRWSLVILAAPMLLLLVLPVGSLLLASSPGEMVEGMRHPLFLSSLWLSLRTTLISLVGVIVGGTPLAWWLATRPGRSTRLVSVLVALPIVLPPAVVGIALLQTFGHRGLLGAWLEALSLQVPFSTAAVVIAQVVVSAPFYIQSAAAAFRRRELFTKRREHLQNGVNFYNYKTTALQLYNCTTLQTYNATILQLYNSQLYLAIFNYF